MKNNHILQNKKKKKHLVGGEFYIFANLFHAWLSRQVEVPICFLFDVWPPGNSSTSSRNKG